MISSQIANVSIVVAHRKIRSWFAASMTLGSTAQRILARSSGVNFLMGCSERGARDLISEISHAPN